MFTIFVKFWSSIECSIAHKFFFFDVLSETKMTCCALSAVRTQTNEPIRFFLRRNRSRPSHGKHVPPHHMRVYRMCAVQSIQNSSARLYSWRPKSRYVGYVKVKRGSTWRFCECIELAAWVCGLRLHWVCGATVWCQVTTAHLHSIQIHRRMYRDTASNYSHIQNRAFIAMSTEREANA